LSEVERLSHLALRVTDLEQAVKFYTEVVGLTVLARPKPGEPPLVVLKEGIGLKPASAKAAGTVIDHMAFKVGSLAPVIARLAAAGVPLADGPRPSPYGNSIYFLDPDGNKVECHDGERR
jgi:catechol 2,3-dioxygenase-like lactoylglutathione lyase family enzyme